MAAVPFESTNHGLDRTTLESNQLQLELSGRRGGTYSNLDVFKNKSFNDASTLGLTDLKIDGLDDGKHVLLAQARPSETAEQAQLQRRKEVSDKTHKPTEHELVQQKIIELHKKYGVDFSANGEIVKVKEPPEAVKCREPNLRELKAIEEALKKNPSGIYEPVGSPGVKFYFLEKNADPNLYAFFNQADGRNAIFIQPNLDKIKHVLNKEAPVGAATVEAIVAHELEHNATAVEGHAHKFHLPGFARELGDNKAIEDRPIDAKLERDYGQLGWTRIKFAEVDVWAIQSRNGRLYVPVPTDDGEHGWVPINKQGQFLDDDGKPMTSPGEVSALDDNQMRNIAKVKPITNYFLNPEEMLAEGMSYYHSEEKRAYLAKQNPQYYELCKRIDQERINRRYGVKASGEPGFMRDVNGEIVAHNSTNLAKVRAFELRAKNQH